MKTRKLSVVLSVVTLLALTGCDAESFFNGTSASSGYIEPTVETTPADTVEEHEISADTPYKTIGDEEGVLFETALNEEDIAENAEVGLYDDTHTKVSDLYDDGSHGDRFAGDGIYACRYMPESVPEGTQAYSIKIGDFETKQTSVRYFDPVTEEDVKASEQTEASFTAAIEDLTDASGNIPEYKRDEAIDRLKAVAEQLQISGEIVEYRINSQNNLVAKLSSGITYVQDLQIPGYDAGHCSRDLSVWTCQPCLSGYQDLDDYMKNPDAGAKAIAEEFDNITFSRNMDDAAVTLETVRGFTSNQIVLWHGHGGYDEKLHSYILTGHPASSGSISSSDYVEDRVVRCKSGVLAFTYKFVDAYCGDLSNSLIYIGTCLSGHDGVLANSFLQKNCELYIGNSDTIYTKYNTKMIRSFAENLAKEKKFLFFIPTGHRTASEAMAAAKNANGQDDGSEEHAKPLLFGSSSYILDEMTEAEESAVMGTTQQAVGSVKLDTTYVSVKVGDTVTVSITGYPNGYKASDFKWTVDDKTIAANSGGTIRGVANGTTFLKVESTDGKYSQFCAISVTS